MEATLLGGEERWTYHGSKRALLRAAGQRQGRISVRSSLGLREFNKGALVMAVTIAIWLDVAPASDTLS